MKTASCCVLPALGATGHMQIADAISVCGVSVSSESATLNCSDLIEADCQFTSAGTKSLTKSHWFILLWFKERHLMMRA